MKITGIAVTIRSSFDDGSCNDWGDNNFFDTPEEAIEFLNDVKTWENDEDDDEGE